jgi:hypothetical protein
MNLISVYHLFFYLCTVYLLLLLRLQHCALVNLSNINFSSIHFKINR